MFAGDLVNLEGGGTYLSKFTFSSFMIRDRIYEHIVNAKLSDGLDRLEYIGIKGVRGVNWNFDATGVTSENIVLKRGVRTNSSPVVEQYFEPTVENLRSLINGHEVAAHIILNIGGSPDEHYDIHAFQVRTPQFQRTTDNFKAHVLSQMATHAALSTNKNNISKFKNDKFFYSLFNQYGKGRLQEYQPKIYNRFYK